MRPISPFTRTMPPIPDAARRAMAPGARARLHGLPPCAAWTALIHPDTWRVTEDASGQSHLLPGVLRLWHVPGAGGVSSGRDADGRPAPAVAGAVAAAEDRGSIPIPDAPVWAFGAAQPGYCCRYAGERGVLHTWAWQRPVIMHRRSELETDHDARISALYQWMRDLLGVDVAPDDVAQSHRAAMIRRERVLTIEAGRNPRRLDELHLVRHRLASLGWGEAVQVQIPHPSPNPAQPPAPAQSDDTAAELAALRAELAALRAPAAASAQPSVSAPPPAPEGGPVGSPAPAGGAVPPRARRPMPPAGDE